MANDSQASAAIGAGEIFNTTDLTTFTAVSVDAKLPGCMLFATGGSGTKPTPLYLGSALSAASLPIVIASDQVAVAVKQSGTWNITNVSGTISLPTGASTSAKQPALGTAGTASTDVITIQGIASMTKLLVTPDANSAINVAQMNGVATTMGNGVSGTGVQRVTIASDSTGQVALAAGSAVIGHVIVDSGTVTTVSTVAAVTAITNALPAGTNTLGGVTNVGTATGSGLTQKTFVSANSDNATCLKASAGQVYSIQAFNLNAAPRYLKFQNKATTPTIGTDTNTKVIMIPGNTAGAGVVINFHTPIPFSTGISYGLVTGIANNDDTSVGAGDCVVNIDYI
jgi:hypothetical protein